MIPTRALLARVQALLKADETWRKTDGASDSIYPIVANFTPAPGLDIDDITYDATGFSSGAHLLADLDFETGIDAVTGDYVFAIAYDDSTLQLDVADAGPLPFTVYGFAVIQSTEEQMNWYEKLPDPITFLGQGQSMPVFRMEVRIPVGAWR